jgi:type II secretory pathway predicted ATPase ExeA
MLLRLNQWLLERFRAGGTTVLIIDEAQNLSLELLEEVRLLTNLETSSEKLLQIVLSGQPELEHKLGQPQVRQLRQRITLRSKTYPLSLEETRHYVEERLKVAGWDGRTIFPPAAMEAIHQYAHGIPRVVNLLCEHALINGFADHQPVISPETILELVKEFELDVAWPIAPPSAPAPQELLGHQPSLRDGGAPMSRLRR